MDINTADILALMESDDRFKHKIEGIKSVFGSKLDKLNTNPTMIESNIKEDSPETVNSMDSHLSNIDDTVDDMYKAFNKFTNITITQNQKNKFFDESRSDPVKALSNTTIFKIPKHNPDKSSGILSTLLAGVLGSSGLGLSLPRMMPRILASLPTMMPVLLKSLPVAGLVAGVLGGVFDGIMGYFKADEWGVSQVNASLSAFFGGTGSGLSGAGSNALKGAGIGAGIGMIGGPMGSIVGALLGSAVGGILGYVGGEKIAKYMDDSVIALAWRDTVKTLQDPSLNLGEKFTKLILGAPLYEFLTTGDTSKFKEYIDKTLGEDMVDMMKNSKLSVGEKVTRFVLGNDEIAVNYWENTEDEMALRLSNTIFGSDFVNAFVKFAEGSANVLFGKDQAEYLRTLNAADTTLALTLGFGPEEMNDMKAFQAEHEQYMYANTEIGKALGAYESLEDMKALTEERKKFSEMGLAFEGADAPVTIDLDKWMYAPNPTPKDDTSTEEIVTAINNMSAILSGNISSLPDGIAEKMPEVDGSTFNTFNSKTNVNQSSPYIPNYRNAHLNGN